MTLKGTIFGFYGTKSLRKNYNIGKKGIITIRFKVFSKNGKMAKNSILQFLNFLPFFCLLYIFIHSRIKHSVAHKITINNKFSASGSINR